MNCSRKHKRCPKCDGCAVEYFNFPLARDCVPCGKNGGECEVEHRAWCKRMSQRGAQP